MPNSRKETEKILTMAKVPDVVAKLEEISDLYKEVTANITLAYTPYKYEELISLKKAVAESVPKKEEKNIFPYLYGILKNSLKTTPNFPECKSGLGHSWICLTKVGLYVHSIVGEIAKDSPHPVFTVKFGKQVIKFLGCPLEFDYVKKKISNLLALLKKLNLKDLIIKGDIPSTITAISSYPQDKIDAETRDTLTSFDNLLSDLQKALKNKSAFTLNDGILTTEDKSFARIARAVNNEFLNIFNSKSRLEKLAEIVSKTRKEKESL